MSRAGADALYLSPMKKPGKLNASDCGIVQVPVAMADLMSSTFGSPLGPGQPVGMRIDCQQLCAETSRPRRLEKSPIHIDPRKSPPGPTRPSHDIHIVIGRHIEGPRLWSVPRVRRGVQSDKCQRRRCTIAEIQAVIVICREMGESP